MPIGRSRRGDVRDVVHGDRRHQPGAAPRREQHGRGLRRGSRRRHPSGFGRVHGRGHRPRRPAGAAALVFILRTPGGLLDSTRTIISHMLAARRRSRLHRAVRRARRLGRLPAHASRPTWPRWRPARTSARRIRWRRAASRSDETMAKKMAADVAAYARTLAAGRQRNVALAERGGEQQPRLHRGRSAQRLAAAHRSRGARRPDDLLRSSMAERSRASTADGSRCTPRARGVSRVEMTWRQRVLSAIAHPQVAYLLLTLGCSG